MAFRHFRLAAFNSVEGRSVRSWTCSESRLAFRMMLATQLEDDSQVTPVQEPTECVKRVCNKPLQVAESSYQNSALTAVSQWQVFATCAFKQPFLFDSVNPGAYRLVVGAPGYPDARFHPPQQTSTGEGEGQWS